MKRISVALLTLTLACSLLLCGCSLLSEKEKTFTSGELTIQLTNRFFESEYEGYDVVFDSSKVTVFVLKEEFSAAFGKEKMLNDYAELVIDTNEMKDVTVQTKDGLTYFTYSAKAEKDDYTYYAFVYKTDDAFWMIQFACEGKSVDRQIENFFQYAKSVTFQ